MSIFAESFGYHTKFAFFPILESYSFGKGEKQKDLDLFATDILSGWLVGNLSWSEILSPNVVVYELSRGCKSKDAFSESYSK